MKLTFFFVREEGKFIDFPTKTKNKNNFGPYQSENFVLANSMNECHQNKGRDGLRYRKENCFPVEGNNEINF
jgi:hypothetical protein